jgi:drug/metabolite transporter (DMT)-like permease
VPRRRTELWGLLAGVLASAAVLAFLLASQRGLLAVAAVLTSLYPAFTVVLATAALREHVYRAQAVGLVLSGCAVALVAAG